MEDVKRKPTAIWTFKTWVSSSCWGWDLWVPVEPEAVWEEVVPPVDVSWVAYREPNVTIKQAQAHIIAIVGSKTGGTYFSILKKKSIIFGCKNLKFSSE